MTISRLVLPLLLLAIALPARAAVTIEEQGDFVKIREVDGAVTLQLLYLKKRDVSAVTYSKTDFNRGELQLIMHYRDTFSDPGGFVIYRLGVPPNKDGENMADKIIRMIEPDRGGHVTKRELILPGR